MAARSQLARGVTLAAVAALLFGVTAPLLARASAGVGSLAASCLLYLGASAGALCLLFVRARRLNVGFLAGRALRVILVAGLGAVVAPALLVGGLRSSNAATASLLLALEAPFTLILARGFLGEYLGRRVILAAALIFAGGLLLGTRLSEGARAVSATGAVLVVAAGLAWAMDNLLSRELADGDPIAVVAAKGILGAGMSAATAVLLGEALPSAASAGALIAIGALGYGVSLQFYLRAQSLVGAARTASVFAAAPFIGAGAALVLGAPWPGWRLPVAAVLMLAGIALHISERHSHRHAHEPIEHDHLHSHDDGHHDHRHDPMPVGPHGHAHRHEPVSHEHAHSEDLHHRHRH